MAALKFRSAATNAVDWKREIDEDGAPDTPGTLSGKQYRAVVDTVENSEKLLGHPGACCYVGDLRLACVSDKDVAEEHAQ